MRTEAPGEQAQSLSQSSSLWRFIFGKNPTWTIVRILIVLVATLIVFRFVLVPIRVTGESMFPTYRNGQVKFVNKLAYRTKDPQRGDVIAVEFKGKEVLLLKRVIAVAGETFQVVNGEVLINGERIVEPYAHGKIPASRSDLPGNTEPIPMGKDEYFIIGDNRPISEGYREHRRKIVGKVF